MTQCCQRCLHVLPSEFFYRKKRFWKTCTECSNKTGKKQFEIPATLPDFEESSETPQGFLGCLGCFRSFPASDFVRRGRTWKTCNACSEKWCSNKKCTTPIACSVCCVCRKPEQHFRRNRYWQICNKCATTQMIHKRFGKSTEKKHDRALQNPPETLSEGLSAPD